MFVVECGVVLCVMWCVGGRVWHVWVGVCGGGGGGRLMFCTCVYVVACVVGL